MFANIKSKSSLFRIAVLSLLAAGCTKRKVKIEEIFVDEVFVTTSTGKTTFSLDSRQEKTLRELIQSIDKVKAAEGDDGQKYHVVCYIYNTPSGNKSVNRGIARHRAEESVKIVRALGYDGPISFIFSVADTPGLKFSVSSIGAGLPLTEALEKTFGHECKTKHGSHKAKLPAKQKVEPKPMMMMMVMRTKRLLNTCKKRIKRESQNST